VNRSLLLLSSFLLAAFSACPPPAVSCATAKCAGCCDAAGLCQSGTLDTACGGNSLICSACSAGLTCQANVCASTSMSGGGAGGGTGGGSSGGGSGGGATGGSGGAGGGQTGTLTVSGHVTYDFVKATYSVAADNGTLDFAHATPRPVRNGVVRVLEGTTVLATTNAAIDGAYTLTFTATSAGPLAVQALAKTSAPPVTVQDNTSSDAVWAIGAPVPLGGGTVDLHREGRAVVTAGAGELVTRICQGLLGVGRDSAERAKRHRAARVETPFVLHHEDGSRTFLGEPAPPDALAHLCVLAGGPPEPLATTLAPEVWGGLRRSAKQSVIGRNVRRAIDAAGGVPRGELVTLVGGCASDPEVLDAVAVELGDLDVAVARGNVLGRHGPRAAVAVGLVLAYAAGA